MKNYIYDLSFLIKKTLKETEMIQQTHVKIKNRNVQKYNILTVIKTPSNFVELTTPRIPL